MPDTAALAFLAAAQAYLDNDTAAAKNRDALLKAQPEFSTAEHIEPLHYKNQSDRDHLRDGMIKAGLPT